MPSRPVLIGRGLVTHTPTKPTATTNKNKVVTTPRRTATASTNQNLNQQTHPGNAVHARPTRQRVNTTQGRDNSPHTSEQVHHVTAAIAARKHPDPSRTRKLSQPAPRVLHPTGCGRVGRRRTSFFRRGHRKVAPSVHFPHRMCRLSRLVGAAYRAQELVRAASSTGWWRVRRGRRCARRGWRARR